MTKMTTYRTQRNLGGSTWFGGRHSVRQ